LCEITDERVSLDVGKIIQKGRVDKKMSQKDLATVGYETIDQGSNFIAAIVVEG
jgi:ribosome-binding protein aMBF1 (putative translation factor)